MESPNIEIREFPAEDSGVSLVSVDDLVSRCATDPGFREAIDVMERAAGAPSELKVLVRKQLTRDFHADRRALSQRRAIDFARRKKAVVQRYGDGRAS